MGWQNRTFSDLVEDAVQKRKLLLDRGLPVADLEHHPFPVNDREAEAIDHYIGRGYVERKLAGFYVVNVDALDLEI